MANVYVHMYVYPLLLQLFVLKFSVVTLLVSLLELCNVSNRVIDGTFKEKVYNIVCVWQMVTLCTFVTAQAELKDLIRKGVSDTYRGRVWKWCIYLHLDKRHVSCIPDNAHLYFEFLAQFLAKIEPRMVSEATQ